MFKAFIAGGVGMYPTLIAGLGLLFYCLRYALRPEPRFAPLMLCLGVLTLVAGALGFVAGEMSVMKLLATEEMNPVWLYVGTGEALNNLLLALGLTTFSAFVASVGAWRQSRQASAEAAVSTR